MWSALPHRGPGNRTLLSSSQFAALPSPPQFFDGGGARPRETGPLYSPPHLLSDQIFSSNIVRSSNNANKSSLGEKILFSVSLININFCWYRGSLDPQIDTPGFKKKISPAALKLIV